MRAEKHLESQNFLVLHARAKSAHLSSTFFLHLHFQRSGIIMSERKSDAANIANPESWVDAYGDFLYRFALSRVKDPSVAEDLVQETFLAALRAYENFKGRSAGRTWLVAILKHKIVDYIRKKIREPSTDKIETLTDLADPDFNDHGEWQIRPFKWAINPDKIYEQKEFLNVLYRCLAELPDRLAEAFMLREMDGLSTEEICKVMDITATNSWVMLYRARMSLRRCIENKWLSAGQ
jgi:RNA polymerase sigma-70 factor (ECF subfamily)